MTRRQSVAAALRRVPLASDPAVVAFLARPINVVLTVTALVMFAVAWPTLSVTHHVLTVLLPVVAAFASLPIMLAWARPAPAWGVSVISAVVIGLAFEPVNGWAWHIQVVHVIEILVLTTATFLRGPIRFTPIAWAATCLITLLGAPAGARAGWIAGVTVLFVICVLVRVLVRSRRQLAQETELKDVAASRSAVLAERARIARDLHDVVAHRMSVVVVAAQTARYRVDGVSDTVDAEFQSIAGMAREALDEVRQMLGVLRVDDDAAPQAPTPGVADIDRLVAATRGAGMAVDYTLTGRDATVPETVGVVAYRIVQEGLANAARHAPSAPVSVAVDVSATVVSVTVRNGPGDPAPSDTHPAGGHGIPGMVERAHAVGGSVDAAPDGHGGFRVAAVLPSRPPLAAITAG
ncbi:MAG: histidine kinase [Corynebacteriales bacterium]|uniref:histidine kinase n=1 Tax=Williamsia herbipolensis TaxID=1603258 RepID=A0AAU4K568_9NOCA|nr:histidine kinase [Williamsia herbipolensis]MCX6469932.1 histidine kinase [Mycobacteriales bacterium]